MKVLFLVAVHAVILICQMPSLRRFRLRKTGTALFALLGLSLALSMLLAFNVALVNPVEWIEAAFGPFGQAVLQR